MRHFFRKVVFGCLLLAFSHLPLLAQDETGRLFLKNFAPRDYRGSDQVTCSLQVDSGVMFFGTNDSILEFDGSVWRSWNNSGNAVEPLTAISDQEILVTAQGDWGVLTIKGPQRSY